MEQGEETAHEIKNHVKVSLQACYVKFCRIRT